MSYSLKNNCSLEKKLENHRIEKIKQISNIQNNE